MQRLDHMYFARASRCDKPSRCCINKIGLMIPCDEAGCPCAMGLPISLTTPLALHDAECAYYINHNLVFTHSAPSTLKIKSLNRSVRVPRTLNTALLSSICILRL